MFSCIQEVTILTIIANIANNNNTPIALTLKWPVKDSPSVEKEKKKARKNERTNE
jgi:hypothetical protein